MNREEFYSVLKHVPKAEVHVHIEAVSTIETIKALYKKRFDKDMTEYDIKNLFSYEDLNGFIQAFLQVQDLFQSVDDFNYVFDDLAAYLIDNNVSYCEAFFAPSAFIKKGFKYEDMVNIFSKKIEEIKEKHGIIIKLLLDVSRTFGCENAMNNYNLLKQCPCKHIIGIGLGGAEQKGPAKEFASVFMQAHKDGYHAVAHAGEDVGPESIWDAINYLQSERIGHGITAIQDESLMENLSKTKLPIEVCVTSNIFTKKIVQNVADHPIRKFFDKKMFVTVNTDDPVFFKTTLIEEYWKIHNECNFTMEEIKQLILNSFNALFISENEKKEYCEKVEVAWAEAVK